MSYRYERAYGARSRSGSRLRSTLIALTVLVWLLVLACVALRLLVRPALTDYINRQIAVTIDPAVPAELKAEAALRESLQHLPWSVTLPPGRFEVTEAMANDYLYAQRAQLGEIEQVQVDFRPEIIAAQVTLRRFPLSGMAYTTPVVQDGRIVATNTRLDPPLGAVVSIEPLMAALVGRFNASVAEQGRRVTAIEIQEDRAIIEIE
ncbi:hypothetical protein [Kallotenue papyrolyticum]|uniref:hypothetical protein n=1 Tax=Kallotenue papyrolyticum TaxID=1325125 RepID=UPI0004785501|nr:hypothetical protein [Kallotenue papyrolyticum]